MKAELKLALLLLVVSPSLLASGCDNGPCGPFPEGTDLDGDGVACEDDCQDLSAVIFPGAPELCDGWLNNCDGELPESEIDHDGDGFLECGLDNGPVDCEPEKAHVYPGAPEFCDGIDNDCDPSTAAWPGDELDADADGSPACADCDDGDPDVYPGQAEDCDGIDSDCDGIGDAWTFDRLTTLATEADHNLSVGYAGNLYAVDESVALEGFAQRVAGFSSTWGTSSPRLLVYRWMGSQWSLVLARPLLAPDSGDWWRTDGDLGFAFEAGAQYLVGAAGHYGTATALFAEGQGELVLPMGVATAAYYGPAGMPSALAESDMTALAGHWAQSLVWRQASEIDQDGDGVLMCLDCDDAGEEICDGFDGDCDGLLDPSEIDQDLDGFVSCAGDCDDTDSDVAPHGAESCDGIDSNCLPEGSWGDESDQDGDGYAACDGDCDDTDPTVYPGAPELCDSIDQDCDGDHDDWRVDNDGDGVWDCFDCMPNWAGAAPGLEDSCTSSYDLNCDGFAGPGVDLDGDGLTACEGDCDDSHALVSPQLSEIDGDGLDNDCDGVVDGMAPAIRVTFDDLEVEEMESFWAPEDIRRPRTRGDYAVFTRAADGSVVDLEALQFDPVMGGLELDPPPMWSDVMGTSRLSGTVWLDATDAVQVVVATLNPYQEVDVRLLPTVAPPPPATGIAFASLDACEGLVNAASPSAMLVELEGYFPWIEFDDPNAYDAWSGLAGTVDFPCDDGFGLLPTASEIATCQQLPNADAIVATCKAFSLMSPAVAASVMRVYWVDSILGALGFAAPGGEIVLDTTGLNNAAFSYPEMVAGTVAHEAAHTYTFEIESGVTPLFPGSGGAIEDSFGQNPPEIGPGFVQLVIDADPLPVTAANCSAGPLYKGLGWMSLSNATARACGFASSYGAKNRREDIATWVEEATTAAYQSTTPDDWGANDDFCEVYLGTSLEALQPQKLLTYGKLALLDMSGFMPPTLRNACLSSYFPWAPAQAGVSRLWTVQSDADVSFDVTAVSSAGQPANTLDLLGSGWNSAAQVHLEDELFASSENMAGLIRLDEADGDYSWPTDYPIQQNTAKSSYLRRPQLDWIPTDAASCTYADPPNVPLGVYGTSIGGIGLVIENSAQTLGLVYAEPWECAVATPDALQDGIDEEDFTYPVIEAPTRAAFQVPASP